MRKQDRTWAKDDKEKAIVFAEHLEKTFQPSGVQLLDNLRRREGTPMQQIPLVAPTELINTIRVHINPKKSSGIWLANRCNFKTAPKESHCKTNKPLQCCSPAEICTQLLEGSWGDYDIKTREAFEWSQLIQTNIIITNTVEVVWKAVLEKLFLKRLKPILDEKQIIPNINLDFVISIRHAIKYIE